MPSALIVHDNREQRELIASAIAGSGFAVSTAETAQAALLAAIGSPPDVVACDTVLRGESGYALAEKLRDDARTRGALLVMLAGPESERAAFAAGAVALLSRPVVEREAATLFAALSDGEGRKDLARSVALLHGRDARAHEADALGSLGRIVERSASTSLGAWAQYHAAITHQARGRQQEAVEELSGLLDEHPAFWRARIRLAIIFEQAGDPATAVHHYRAVLTTLPGLAAARTKIELLAGQQGAMALPATTATPRDDASALAGSDDADAIVPGSRGSILIADDSELALEMIGETLERAGYRVRKATDGKMALDLARAERPDLMILDGLMPGATGFDVCKQVKEVLYPGRAPKVVILSAIYTKQRQRSEAIEIYKADEVLAKPMEDADFLAAVQRHMPPRPA